MSEINRVVRRSDSRFDEDKKYNSAIRLSGTTTDTEFSIDKNSSDGELGPVIGRTQDEAKYPDADYFLVENVTGDRLQDFANSHLSEGPAPGRIPRRWTNLVSAVLGKHATQDVGRDRGVIKANQTGGAEDQRYIQHLGIPRGSIVARAFMRSVDDAAPIPAVYVGDPSRR